MMERDEIDILKKRFVSMVQSIEWDEPLDGDAVDDVVEEMRCELNWFMGNIDYKEYMACKNRLSG